MAFARHSIFPSHLRPNFLPLLQEFNIRDPELMFTFAEII